MRDRFNLIPSHLRVPINPDGLTPSARTILIDWKTFGEGKKFHTLQKEACLVFEIPNHHFGEEHVPHISADSTLSILFLVRQ
jgi:hypothetical protein